MCFWIAAYDVTARYKSFKKMQWFKSQWNFFKMRIPLHFSPHSIADINQKITTTPSVNQFHASALQQEKE